MWSNVKTVVMSNILYTAFIMNKRKILNWMVHIK